MKIKKYEWSDIMEKLYQLTINTLNERGVTIESIAEIVYDLQKDYTDNLTIEYCQETILSVLKKTGSYIRGISRYRS